MTFRNKQNGYQIFWFSVVLSGANFIPLNKRECRYSFSLATVGSPYIYIYIFIYMRYKYKQYIVKHNSMILLRCISYIISFNDIFRL